MKFLSRSGNNKFNWSCIFFAFLTLHLAAAASQDLQDTVARILQVEREARIVRDGSQNEDPTFRTSRSAAPDLVIVDAERMGVQVEGFKMKSYDGRDIASFQGIRYAMQPERFQPPDRLDPAFYSKENDVYKATHLPELCSQSGKLDKNHVTGTEDCLFLNVYTPQMTNVNGTYDELLPVMFYIYGGGFSLGHTYDVLPTRLLDRDVILVTIQYRVGLFGFFSTATKEAKGNAGLYDQLLAMKWVQDYIQDFGGDPEQVTIFGESAGGISVTLHLLSHASEGLFNGVIAESSSALSYAALDPYPVSSAVKTAQVLGCSEAISMDDVLECAHHASEEELVTALVILFDDPKFLGSAPIVQDFLEPEDDPILSSWPAEAFINGDLQANVSLLIGSNRDESSSEVGALFWELSANGLLNNDLFIQEGLIANYLKKNYGIEDKTHALSISLADEYFGDADRTNFNSITPGLIDLMGMIHFKAPCYQTAKLHSLNKNDVMAKTFFYTFDYLSDDSTFFFSFRGEMPPVPHGVTHSDEMMYIFPLPADQDADEIAVKNKMVELWTNFAIYLDPTPDESTTWEENDIEKWVEFDVMNQNFMVMEETFHVDQFFSKRWDINIQESESVTAMKNSKTRNKIKPAAEEEETQCQDDAMELRSLQEDYSDLDQTTNIYLGLMIAFIVLFVYIICLNTFLFYIVYVKK